MDAILEMKKEGYTRSEIIQAMSSQGYTPQEIEEHLSRAERVESEPFYHAESVTLPPLSHAPETESMPAAEVDEELIASIVEDKLSSATKGLSEIDDWKEKVNSRLDKLEQTVHDLKERVDGFNRALIGKMESNEKQMLDTGTEMKAMQKVFKESIPELTEAISSLKLSAGKKPSKKEKK